MTDTDLLPRPRVAVKLALFESGLSAWQAARLAGLSETVLSRIVTGRRVPTTEEASRLAQVLRVSVADLFPGESLPEDAA